MFQITHKDFNLEDILQKHYSKSFGAHSIFLGTVRSDNNKSIFLETYEELAMKQFKSYLIEIEKRFQVSALTIIHRIGELKIGEKIVLVITSAPHRDNAIKANEFVMDKLKVSAAFWKSQLLNGKYVPIDQKKSDLERFSRWDSTK